MRVGNFEITWGSPKSKRFSAKEYAKIRRDAQRVGVSTVRNFEAEAATYYDYYPR